MDRGTKAKVKTKERHITIIIVPSAGGNSKALKIYYPKLIVSAMLCMILCGVLTAGVFARDLLQENHELRANNIELHEVNRAQLQIIKKNDQQIKDITDNNLLMKEKIQQLADLYEEIVQKYKGITEKYIVTAETQTLASRADGRSDKSFVSDLISLQSKIMEASSILALESSNDVLLDARLLLDRFAEALPDFVPLQGRISDRFGYREDPFWKIQRFHSGLDIAAPYGSEIRAAGAGKVVFAGRKGGYGNLVIIDHGYGITTYYGHASRLLVKEGQKVEKGEIIARVGSTGRSTGPHLHFEIRINDVPVDPLNYISLD
ncbi:MAG: M23 family metallopeptidase [Caldicoprobacter sp.]|uniref:M23 family metallopeptidase n=1 Tax=Caldicoprobacter sp. TaxID=2004500 RepID=UPI001D1F18F4|nr:hypothetical protein [Clostridia bacterium]